MLEFILIVSVILLLCVASSKLLYRFGVPALLVFLALGMLFGSDGIVGIRFDNFDLTQKLCSLGLIFIMFYGGYGTNWKAAKRVTAPAVVMSTLGVILTAALTGFFCIILFPGNVLQALLIGAVISSTDAASVFAILRARKLNLKHGLSSLLEVESGSNDPFSYMLTVIMVTLMAGGGLQTIGPMLLRQLGFGLLLGVFTAKATAWVLQHITLEIDGLYPIFMTAMVLLGYSLCEFAGGNGYLCVYLIGIITGNSPIAQKRNIFHFFDGVSWLMQMMLFFTLGLLSFPSRLPRLIVPGILLSLFIMFVARPVATFLLLAFFPFTRREKLLVSWVGLRGAASIVFSIYAVTMQAQPDTDIFHLVFLVALFSVGVQGSLVPFVAKKLQLVRKSGSVFKTFTDYEEESPRLLEVRIDTANPWLNETLESAQIPAQLRVILIKRDGKVFVPNGSTQVMMDDILVMSGENF